MNEELLRDGLRKRDRAVFDFVFNYYYSGLCTYCLQFIPDKELVEDLVQDFFIRLWIEGPRLQINISLRSYFFSSVKNLCLDVIRHSKVDKKYKNSIFFSSDQKHLSADFYLTEAELNLAIQRSITKLPPRCRQIFQMSRMDNYSNAEIAEKLGISKRTVEIQISNALKILRQELSEFLPLWLLLML